MKCKCETPCLVPASESHRYDEMPQGRDVIMCAACGAHWREADTEVVDRVHRENDKLHADEARREAEYNARPRCQRHKDGHRYIDLRSGKSVCRDCGEGQ